MRIVRSSNSLPLADAIVPSRKSTKISIPANAVVVTEIPEGTIAVRLRAPTRAVLAFGDSSISTVDLSGNYHVALFPSAPELVGIDPEWTHMAAYASVATDVEAQWYLSSEAELQHKVITSWSPARLFRPGDQGAFWDFRPPYIFTDSAGTIPALSVSDPIGRALDLSGRGHHAVQNTSSKKPLLAMVGGAYAMDPDNVDDILDALFPETLRTTEAVTYGVAWKYDTTTASNFRVLRSGAGNDMQYGYRPVEYDTAKNAFYDPVISGYRTWGYPSARTTPVTVTMRKQDGKTWITRVDGNEYVDTWPNTAFPNTSQDFRVIGPSSPSSSQLHIFAGFVILRELSLKERQQLEDWLYNRAQGLA